MDSSTWPLAQAHATQHGGFHSCALRLERRWDRIAVLDLHSEVRGRQQPSPSGTWDSIPIQQGLLALYLPRDAPLSHLQSPILNQSMPLASCSAAVGEST